MGSKGSVGVYFSAVSDLRAHLRGECGSGVRSVSIYGTAVWDLRGS